MCESYGSLNLVCKFYVGLNIVTEFQHKSHGIPMSEDDGNVEMDEGQNQPSESTPSKSRRPKIQFHKKEERGGPSQMS